MLWTPTPLLLRCMLPGAAACRADGVGCIPHWHFRASNLCVFHNERCSPANRCPISVGRDCHAWPSCTCALLMLIMAACAWFVCVTTGPESVFTSPPVLGSGCVHMMHACRCLGSCHGKYSTSVAFSDVVYVHHVSSMCCVYIGCWLQLSLWLLDVHISA